MNLFRLSSEIKKRLVFGVVFFYLIGPVFRIYHAYISDIFFLVTFLLVLFSGTRFKLDNIYMRIFLIPCFITVIIIAGKFFMGFELGSDELANFLNYVKLFFLFVLVYSVFMESSSENTARRDLRLLNLILIFFIILVSSIGILQFTNSPIADFIIKNFYHVVHKSGSDNIYEFQLLNRVTSIFDSFNGMGIVLCFTLFIFIFINTELKNYWSILIILLGILMIFLSGNRASLIMLFLMSVSYLLYIKKGFSLKIFGVISVILISSGLIFFLLSNFLSFDNYIRFYEFKLFLQNGSIPPTLQVRLEKWQWIPQYMLSVKQGFFGYTTNDFIKEKIYTSPDNQYLNWLVYYGYIGASLFVFWAIYSLTLLMKKRAGTILSRAVPFTVIYWSGLILIGLVQESFFFGRLRELFIFLLAMTAAYNSLSKKNITETNNV